jgi:chaperonin GroES
VLKLRRLAVRCSSCQNGGRQPPSHEGAAEIDTTGIPCKPGSPPAGVAIGGTGSMKIRPLQDRIIVKRVDEEETTKGGIIIPDTAKEKPQEGKVISVGKGKVNEDGKLQKLDVKKGDKVLFSKYSGTEINIGGEEHLIIREDDVLGVVE